MILSARSARISGCVRSRSTSALRPAMMPRLRPAQQLVAAEADQVDAGGDRRLHRRLAGEIVHEAAAADVFDHRHVHRARSGDQIRERRPLGEAFDAEVRRVHAQEHRGRRRDRRHVIGDPRAVGGADLAQHRARTGASRRERGSRRRSRPARRAKSPPRGPLARPARISMIAAALLLTTMRGFGAGDRGEQRFGVDGARAALAARRGRIRGSL